jgi:hypothetical protein
MKVKIPFLSSTGKADLEVKISDDTERELRLRAALEVAVRRGADLRFANLSHAYLKGADLRGADLSGASLRFATLSYADLSGADLSGADLYRVVVRHQDEKASIPPLFVKGLYWSVMVTDCHITIGCWIHTTDEWAAFDNERIARIGGCSARRFWVQWKEPLLAMARAHQSKVGEE